VTESSKIMLEQPTRALANSPIVIRHLHQCAPSVDPLENLANGYAADSANQQLGWGCYTELRRQRPFGLH
jgi:hypothetical protein